MNICKTLLEGVLIIEPKVFKDHRGWFYESYSKQVYVNHGIDINFVQDNRSYSELKNTIRGLHFQLNPKAQTKLIQCIQGKILDVVVDLRKGSLTYGEWISVVLDSVSRKQLLIPKGFAHGFLTLEDKTEVVYKVDEYYSPELERSIRYNDPILNINWEIDNPIISDKDNKAPLLSEMIWEL